MDNWFRAGRRSQDVAAALRGRGMPLPLAESLYDAAKALLPVWATWLGERAGLPDHLTLF